MGKAEELSARDLTRATTALFFLDSGNGESPLFLSAWTWWLLEVVCPLLLPLRLLLLGAEEPSRRAPDYERRSDPHHSARALLLSRRRRFLSSFSLDAGAHISVMRSPTCWLVVVLRWVPVRDNREREYVVSPPHFYEHSFFLVLFLFLFVFLYTVLSRASLRLLRTNPRQEICAVFPSKLTSFLLRVLGKMCLT